MAEQNAVATQQGTQLSVAAQVKSMISQDAVKKKFTEVLGQKAPQFLASITNVVAGSAQLKKCPATTIMSAAFVAATYDLPIDSNLGFAAIVPYNNNKYNPQTKQWEKHPEAQFQMMYKGFIQLAIRSGSYEKMNCSVVYKDELVSYNPITGEVEFVKDFSKCTQRAEGKSENIAGYYACFKLLTGFRKELFMTTAEVDNHARKYSTAYRYDLENNKKGSKWTTDFEAMALKTVIKMLLSKWGMLSVDMQRAKASCNYGIGTEGGICLVVDECNRSWCSSSGANDQRAVTIECASDKAEPYAFNSTVYNKLIELCADICRRNGKNKLVWISDKNKALAYNPAGNEMLLTVHRWFANKSCPGNWMYGRMGELAQKVNEKLGSAGGNTGGSSGSKNDLPAAPFTVKVLIGDLNYRSEPSMSGAVKGQTGKGVFTISEVKDGWGKLKSGAGWIYLENPEYCTVLGKIASTPAQTSSSYMVRITTSVLNVRKGPGTNYGITTKVKKGEVYTIVAEEKNGNTTWGKLKSGAGYISLGYTERV